MGGGAVVRTAARAAAFGGYRAAHAPWLKKEMWEADGWEFAGGEEEELFGAALRPEPPTPEEAKEAASDLKDALRGLYSPHASAASRNSAVESRPALSESNCLEGSDAKKGCAAVLTSGSRHVVQAFSLPPSAPRHIVQTVSLLQEDPEVQHDRIAIAHRKCRILLKNLLMKVVSKPKSLVQNIVASLASDKDVWDAVMKNEKVMKFYKTHKISKNKKDAQPVEAGACSEESVNENGKCMSGPAKERSPQSSENSLRDFMRSIKLKVKEIVNSLSDLFESFMASTGPGNTTIVRTSTCDRSYEDMAVGASFIALTVATIMLILLKRG